MNGTQRCGRRADLTPGCSGVAPSSPGWGVVRNWALASRQEAGDVPWGAVTACFRFDLGSEAARGRRAPRPRRAGRSAPPSPSAFLRVLGTAAAGRQRSRGRPGGSSGDGEARGVAGPAGRGAEGEREGSQAESQVRGRGSSGEVAGPGAGPGQTLYSPRQARGTLAADLIK